MELLPLITTAKTAAEVLLFCSLYLYLLKLLPMLLITICTSIKVFHAILDLPCTAAVLELRATMESSMYVKCMVALCTNSSVILLILWYMKCPA